MRALIRLSTLSYFSAFYSVSALTGLFAVLVVIVS